jgi:murein L,D-transpeptidase YcbB/YkuD
VLPLFVAAGEVGLEAEDYLIETPIAGATPEATAADAARFEIEMTARALRYAVDARAGRINPNRISGYHDFPENRAEAKALLDEIASGLPGRVLLAQHPQLPQFEALRRELADLKGQQDDVIVIAEGTLIKPGMEHPELANVMRAIAKKASEEFKARYPLVFDEAAPAPVAYTPELVEVVKDFQKENGLSVDGVIGRGTISRLTELGVAQKRDRVILAMEQLRWHPRDLGNPYVFINQPAFRARFVEDGKSKLDMRVVVGTAKNQTSFFHDVIETVEYNPYWGIPQSILVNEYLPKLRQNPAYLDERGYIVTDGRGRRIPSSAIDWWSMGSKVPFDVRQAPGEANALGELKILFPNKHAIYMHDTPQKQLFGQDTRAYSHGCVRLQQPREMAAAVLGTSVDYIAKRLGEGHSQDEVKRKIPVYVAYFTAWPDDNGTVEYFADIYGRDTHLTKAIDATRKARNAAS